MSLISYRELPLDIKRQYVAFIKDRRKNILNLGAKECLIRAKSDFNRLVFTLLNAELVDDTLVCTSALNKNMSSKETFNYLTTIIIHHNGLDSRIKSLLRSAILMCIEENLKYNEVLKRLSGYIIRLHGEMLKALIDDMLRGLGIYTEIIDCLDGIEATSINSAYEEILALFEKQRHLGISKNLDTNLSLMDIYFDSEYLAYEKVSIIDFLIKKRVDNELIENFIANKLEDKDYRYTNGHLYKMVDIKSILNRLV